MTRSYVISLALVCLTLAWSIDELPSAAADQIVSEDLPSPKQSYGEDLNDVSQSDEGTDPADDLDGDPDMDPDPDVDPDMVSNVLADEASSRSLNHLCWVTECPCVAGSIC